MNLEGLAKKVAGYMNDYSHTTIGSLYASAAMTYHLKTGHDLGANFIAFSAYFYGFLLGHAGVNQKWPDPPPQV